MPFISRGTSMRASPQKKQFILQSMIQLIALSPFFSCTIRFYSESLCIIIPSSAFFVIIDLDVKSYRFLKKLQ